MRPVRLPRPWCEPGLRRQRVVSPSRWVRGAGDVHAPSRAGGNRHESITLNSLGCAGAVTCGVFVRLWQGLHAWTWTWCTCRLDLCPFWCPELETYDNWGKTLERPPIHQHHRPARGRVAISPIAGSGWAAALAGRAVCRHSPRTGRPEITSRPGKFSPVVRARRRE